MFCCKKQSISYAFNATESVHGFCYRFFEIVFKLKFCNCNRQQKIIFPEIEVTISFPFVIAQMDLLAHNSIIFLFQHEIIMLQLITVIF